MHKGDHLTISTITSLPRKDLACLRLSELINWMITGCVTLYSLLSNFVFFYEAYGRFEKEKGKNISSVEWCTWCFETIDSPWMLCKHVSHFSVACILVSVQFYQFIYLQAFLFLEEVYQQNQAVNHPQVLAAKSTCSAKGNLLFLRFYSYAFEIEPAISMGKFMTKYNCTIMTLVKQKIFW